MLDGSAAQGKVANVRDLVNSRRAGQRAKAIAWQESAQEM